MSIEMVFYPSCADKGVLCEHLLTFDFDQCDHLWDWPEDSANFSWFEIEDFQSFDGVEATVFPTSDEERKDYPKTAWALHTRTRVWASSRDLEQQNEVIRAARKQFGGCFISDSYGKNRYIPVPPDLRDSVARGIYLSYEYVKEMLSRVKYAIPEPNRSFNNLLGTRLEALSQMDPTRVLYNALLPFAVAAIEHFFMQSFKILLRYDEKARQRVIEQNRKVGIKDVIAIRDGSKTFEDVVANWYSFQRIASINSAFKSCLNIDVSAILHKRKKIGQRLPVLEQRLTSLIEYRHGVVHRFDINLGLEKKEIEEVFDLVVVIIDEFVSHLEKMRSVPIRA